MDVCLFTLFVFSGRGLCDGTISRPEECYRLWCVSECDQVKIKTLYTCCEQVGRRGKDCEKKRIILFHLCYGCGKMKARIMKTDGVTADFEGTFHDTIFRILLASRLVCVLCRHYCTCNLVSYRLVLVILNGPISTACLSQWPHGLRRGSAAGRLLGLWVRIPPGSWMFVSCEYCVLSGVCLCVGLITRPEESYRVWCA
jgi:hypothetical protein